MLKGRCDSFVLKTDVHYPTDINLLFDALRKAVTLTARECQKHNVSGWRQSSHNIKQVKQRYRKAQQLKRSTSKDPKKRAQREALVIDAHRAYLDLSGSFLDRVVKTLAGLRDRHGVSKSVLAEIQSFVAHGQRQMDQIERRVIRGETIPHEEKVFSVFEEHTEWICKGKAGVPVELGLKVCILEDHYGFILAHQTMQKQTDEEVAVSMVEEGQKKFPGLKQCSFDKGFYSPSNRERLGELLQLSALPKKGRLSQKEQEAESCEEFVQARRQHSAVESAINALEVHGLDKCFDRGIEGFKRYAALAIVARNIQQLGALQRKKEFKSQKRRRKRKKAA
ncbi:transposase [Candidatus Nitromaritima sp. SCGC AAA799-A02]|nr:transposase [Candidatus Nitromaritima sp. SCGC AAA799-A02]